MQVEIENTKIFTVDIDCKYHWSKLPKFIKFMRKNYLNFKRGTNLRGANLYDADLRGANLYDADLRGADLRGANLYGVNLFRTNLRDANLCCAILRDANLCCAILYGANLSGANLCCADENTPETLTIKDFMLVQGLGSENRITYFYDTEEIGIVVKCGCFYGTEKAFRKAVKETHKDGQFAKEYLAMLKVVKIRFSRSE